MSDAATDTPVLDLLAAMTADSLEAAAADLDPATLLLVRLAALVAVDAPRSPTQRTCPWRATSAWRPTRSAACSPLSPRSSAPPGSSATTSIAAALAVAIEIAESSRTTRPTSSRAGRPR